MLKRGAAAVILGVASTAAGGAVDAKDSEPMVVDMPMVSVPIIDGGRVEGALQVKLAMNAAGPGEVDRVTAALPRLRSAALVTLVEFARLHASPFRAVDNEKLSASLDKALRQAEPAVASVLLLEVSARAT